MIPNIWGVVLVGKSYDNAYPRNLRDRVSGDENLEKAVSKCHTKAGDLLIIYIKKTS